MPEIKKQQHSWIAGLKEQRIALGIAVAASLAMLVLLVFAPDTTSDNKDNVKKIGPASNAPVYPIPQRQQLKPAKSARAAPHKLDTQSQKKHASKQKITPEKHTAHKTKPASSAKPEHNAKNKNRSTPEKTAQHAVFFVQVGAYREQNSARQQAASLLQKGWNSMVTRNNTGLYVVRIGPVSDRPAAIALHRQLAEKAQLKGFIVQGR
ncbi:MAG: SPOR domain-containing protein [Mariprofundaceae bacterium]|nr:SPOR domain-containing protein [Mariprofundaceae bacterium]